MNAFVSGVIGKTIKLTSEITKLPDILDLKDKNILYIDYVVENTEDIMGEVLSNVSDCYISLIEKDTTNKVVDNQPLNTFQTNFSYNNGNRFYLGYKIDLVNSEIRTNTENVGKNIYLLFWYRDEKIVNTIEKYQKIKYDCFDVNITNVSDKKYIFNENRTLFGKKFYNIIENDQNISPNGVTVSSGKNAYLFLKKDNYEFVRGLPISTIRQINAYDRLRFEGVEFDFTNSFVKVSPNTNVIEGECFSFAVQYFD